MRITGGQAKGRVVKLKVAKGVRPTSGRVREALFSMVGQDLSGERIADAFGGSGLLALEAWSRGAEVVVVERSRKTAALLRASATELGARVEVRVGDALQVVPTLHGLTGVLADPPYAMDPAEVLPALAAAQPDWLVYEAARDAVLPPTVGSLVLDRKKTFGNTVLAVYRAATEDEDA